MKNLKEDKQFLFWYIKGNSKVPVIYEPSNNTMFCRTTKYFNPEKHLLTYAEALKIFESKTYKLCNMNGINGIGYFLDNAKYGILDLDNAFLDGTETPRGFMQLLIDIAKKKNSCIFYSVSQRGLHIPYLRKINLHRFSAKLNQFSDIDIDTKVVDDKGKPKHPGVEYFTNQPRHVAFTWIPYNNSENITVSDEDFEELYTIMKDEVNKGKDEAKKAKQTNNTSSSNNNNSSNNTNDKNYSGDENINYTLNHCSIDDVLSDFMGYNYPGQKDYCPFHSGSPAFERFQLDINKFICYGTECEVGKDSKSGFRIIDCINVVEHAESCNTLEAMKKLRDKYFPDHKFTFEKYDNPINDFAEEETKKNYMDDFLDEIETNLTTPVISSGFIYIDKLFNGGLYPGLYTIGAISSLGKTAFTLQMADQIAEHGQPVLFFSLEMPRTELIARSISRLMTQNNYNECKNIGTNQVLYGKAREYHKVEFENAFNYYNDKIFPNLKIIECPFNTNHKYITKTVDSYVEKTGIKPVVFIDYLQIINIDKEDVTEKRGIDNIVKALKQLSRDLRLIVFVVSSFNRENYNSPVSFNSFKESGGIEYTSDFILGLQLSILDELKDDIKNKNGFNAQLKEAKKGNIEGMREVSLVILKNRNGISNSIQCLKFYGKNNLFTEIEKIEKDRIKTKEELEEEELNKKKQERYEEEKKKKDWEKKVKEDLKKKKHVDDILSDIDENEIKEKRKAELRRKKRIDKLNQEAEEEFKKEEEAKDNE